jgi:hypothetical protein
MGPIPPDVQNHNNQQNQQDNSARQNPPMDSRSKKISKTVKRERVSPYSPSFDLHNSFFFKPLCSFFSLLMLDFF